LIFMGFLLLSAGIPLPSEGLAQLMKLRLFKQAGTKGVRTFSIAALTALSAMTTLSCSRNTEVLVTEIGVSSPTRRSGRTSKAEEFYIQGKNQHLKGNLQGAIASYNKAISLNSQYGAAYKGRGLAYFDLGKKQEAIADYNQAIRINANDAEAFNSRGNARASQGDHRGSVEDYNEAIRLAPNYAEAFNNRGNARSSLGDKNGALDDIGQAIRLNPRYAIAYNNRGNVRASQGDNKGAITDYNQAIRLNPNFGAAYNNRGNARAAEGDKPGALKDLQRAADIFQNQDNKDLYQQVMNNIKELGQ
jgi:tetratricopeptide (TPR) repeat protein